MLAPTMPGFMGAPAALQFAMAPGMPLSPMMPLVIPAQQLLASTPTAMGVTPQMPPTGMGAVPQAVQAVEGERALLEQFPAYCRVQLCELYKNLDLNGKYGVVVPQSVSVWPEVPGCLKVRLASGQEVAVKPGNMCLAGGDS